MPNQVNMSLLFTSSTGDQPSEETITRTIYFNRYAVEIELTTDGKFLGIVSIKLQKSFIEENMQTSDVHDVEEFYREE